MPLRVLTLKSHDSAALESKVGLEVLSDLTNQSLEWELADEELSGLLVSSGSGWWTRCYVSVLLSGRRVTTQLLTESLGERQFLACTCVAS